MDTETMDKLYLEYSQMTTARTWREIALRDAVMELISTVIAMSPPGTLTLAEIDISLKAATDVLSKVAAKP